MEKYRGQATIGWKMSEKFDGVQGIWDGTTLKTRSGNTIAAPCWWTRRLPRKKLVGELWAGRGKFDYTRSVVCSSKADRRWQDIKFVVFDEIAQVRIASQKQFDGFYNRVINLDGEGLVLTAPSGEQMKHKPVEDSEGILIGYKKGGGRNAGRIGAFVLKLRNGRFMNLSNGLINDLRRVPPKIGSVIRFNFSGKTSSGLPRFAVFAGVRAETALEF